MKGLLKFLFTITVGALYGALFAQKSGKKLRAELKKSKNPLKTLLEEGVQMDLEARDTISDIAKNSPALQNIINTGKEQFTDLVNQAKNMSSEQREKAKEKLEDLAENAKAAAKELGETATEKVSKAKEEATAKGKIFKNQIEENVKTIASKIKK